MTILDLAFLSLFTLNLLVEESVRNNILLVGITKDTAARDLLTHLIIAALAPRNAPDFDILATKHNHTVRIRVKTKSAEYEEWQWMRKKDGTIFRSLSTDGDFAVLVDLARETKNMKFYVVPTHKLDAWLKETFDKWAKTLGRNDRPHDKTTPKRNLNQETYGKELAKYLDNWEELGFP